ncbi:nuclear transport factor 2 family protein [Nonomuraea dietziae]|uniref:nuclear transport factor 2 family protein n=1 Tax=Nonomuraea dietziae TaxID=65515 RepID=UPI0033D80408
MSPFDGVSPEQFIADFMTSFTDEIVRGEEDPGPIVDRYYTPDMIQIADGVRIDRDKLIAHIRPVRKNLTHYRLEVHEALASGNRIAARFTLHGQMRKKAVATEVHFFGELAADGRMSRAHQLTRALPTGQGGQGGQPAPGKEEEA